MENDSFQIVFQKLAEAEKAEESENGSDRSALSVEELESLDELRRIVEETIQPQVRLFTTT